jgi:NitT/TauT family transport system ATP-binding protein
MDVRYPGGQRAECAIECDTPSADSSQPIILEANSLLHNYNGLPVIGPVSFAIRRGEGIAIMAPVGAGKSTLLRLLLGAQVPRSGARKVFPLPDAVGVAFQEDNLLPWLTVRENLLLLNSLHRRDVDEERLKELVYDLRLASYEHYLPSRLSSGMKQKVGVGRLLLYRPSLYVLDEALAHVDELARGSLCSALADRITTDQASVILVTHNPTDALQVADSILIGTTRPLTVRSVFSNPVPRDARRLGPTDPMFRAALDQLVALIADA